MIENQINGSDVDFAVQAGMINGGIHVRQARPSGRMGSIYRELYRLTKILIEAIPSTPILRPERAKVTLSHISYAQNAASTFFEEHEPDIMLFAPLGAGEIFQRMKGSAILVAATAHAMSRVDVPAESQPLPKLRKKLEADLAAFAKSIPR
ncbi:hypothetical protein [Kitasatospora sp. NPDC001547]|uniref:hypothetical protein n=1 Tax=Kitasatospora sp. NPDC001547 TaxID=3364015 RepID=UPI0036B1FF1A|nr:hypothetical protein KitaXyl93_51730 [Kitasatospora sp. Xyl93]